MALQQVGTTVPMNQTNPAVYDSAPFDGEDVAQLSTVQAAPTYPAEVSASVASFPTNHYATLHKMGFEDMKGDWRSEPMISLKDGTFEDATGNNYGKEFIAYATGGRYKYAWQVPNGNAKHELAYTYEHPSAGLTEDQIGEPSIKRFSLEFLITGKTANRRGTIQ